MKYDPKLDEQKLSAEGQESEDAIGAGFETGGLKAPRAWNAVPNISFRHIASGCEREKTAALKPFSFLLDQLNGFKPFIGADVPCVG